MNRKIRNSWMLGAAAFGLQACMPAYHLQNARLRGPVMHDVPEMAEAGPQSRVKVRPYVYVQPSADFHFNDGQHTPVNGAGVFAYTPVADNPYVNFHENDTDNVHRFQGENVHWKRETLAFGADLSLRVLQRGFLRYGLGLSNADGSFFASHALGWGLGGALGRMGLRFDGTVFIHPQEFAADMVKRESGGLNSGSPDRQGWIYSKSGRRHYASFLMRATANTLEEILGLRYSLSLESGNTYYFSNNEEFAGVVLGWSKDLPRGFRIQNGLRLRKYLDLQSAEAVQTSLYGGMEFGFGN